MITDWKDFLLDAGAEFNDAGVVHFGNLRRELSVAITGNVFTDLSHYGLISVHGDDAETLRILDAKTASESWPRR